MSTERPRSPTAATPALAWSFRTADPKGGELTGWQVEHNREHERIRARIEHVFARMKTWKILRDFRLKGDGVHHTMLVIARLHNLLQAA